MCSLREAAFNALTGNLFIEDSLYKWQIAKKPTQRDFNLAYEIANGTARQKGSLELLAKRHFKALPKKKKEKFLLYMMLYQIYFLDRIPLYAIVQEGVEIAKNNLSSHFAKFINAAFRNFEKLPFEFSDALSYPKFFVEKLREDYGDEADSILHCMNQRYPIQARDRKTHKMVEVTDLKKAILDPSIYIQNGSFIEILLQLKNHLKKDPKAILDLCANPGGKLIAVHDFFPNAALFANDIQIEKLEENLRRYNVEAHVTKGRAEQYKSETLFDLIICDLPCSNSGVLGKRPEARWRLCGETLSDLEKLQIAILKHAKTLLNKGGQIWYMTCSILKDENIGVAERSGLFNHFDITHLPDEKGFDGGYGAVLT